jgi:hypothetical protein
VCCHNPYASQKLPVRLCIRALALCKGSANAVIAWQTFAAINILQASIDIHAKNETILSCVVSRVGVWVLVFGCWGLGGCHFVCGCLACVMLSLCYALDFPLVSLTQASKGNV